MDPQPPRTRPYFADTFDGSNEAGLDPHDASGWLIDRLESAVKLSPDWFVDDEARPTPFRLSVLAYEPEVRLRVGIEGGGIGASVSFSRDASGYVLALGAFEGREVFRGYIDIPYEECDIWPAGAEFPERRTVEAPGRLGKRLTWAVINTAIWPELAGIANELGYLLAQSRDGSPHGVAPENA